MKFERLAFSLILFSQLTLADVVTTEPNLKNLLSSTLIGPFWTVTNLAENTVAVSTHQYKMAVVNAEQSALAVLDGNPADDLFYDAVAAAEALVKQPIEGDDTTRAMVLLELGNTIRAESK